MGSQCSPDTGRNTGWHSGCPQRESSSLPWALSLWFTPYSQPHAYSCDTPVTLSLSVLDSPLVSSRWSSPVAIFTSHKPHTSPTCWLNRTTPCIPASAHLLRLPPCLCWCWPLPPRMLALLHPEPYSELPADHHSPTTSLLSLFPERL